MRTSAPSVLKEKYEPATRCGWCDARELNPNSHGEHLEGYPPQPCQPARRVIRRERFPAPLPLIGLFRPLIQRDNVSVKPKPRAVVVYNFRLCELVTKPLDRLPVRPECSRCCAKIKPCRARFLHVVNVVN